MGKREDTATSTMRTPRRRLKREETYDQVDMCQKLYDALKAAKDSEGKFITDPFIRVPSRRTDAEYYNVVNDPIDFTRINQRLRAYEYNSFSDFCKDIELVISNAHLYYKEDSAEYLSATELQKVYEELKAEHENPADPDETTTPSPNFGEKGMASSSLPAGIPDQTKMEHILALILGLTDKHGRLLSPLFRVLVTVEELPDYYQIVKNPIDLKTIASKSRSGAYKSWAAFDEDIQLLVNNCKKFNSSTSQIYKDAVKINAFYEQKKAEILAPKFVVDKSKITENKKIINSLLEQKESNDNSELSEDSEEDDDTGRDTNPLWVLYWGVRNLPGDKKNQGNVADPFLELPNKQHYPDYYDEILNPMSLYVINKRLKSGYYNSLQYLVDDLLLICFNARCYNMESSDFYRAACKLEKFISKKARELDPTVTINIAEVPNEDEEMEMGDEEEDEAEEEEEEEEQPKPERKKRAHVSIAESDNNDSEASFIRPPSHKKRKKSEFTEFGSEIGRRNMEVRVHRQGRKSIEEHQHIYRNKLLRVLNTVKNYNLHGRLIAEPLLYVPDPKQFPEYYAKVKKPIDLTTIQNNVDTFTYKTSGEFMNDLFTLFTNVRLLYPPQTEIVQHANILQETAAATMKHITKGQVIPIPVRKTRTGQYRSRRSAGSPAATPSRTSNRASLATPAAFASPGPESRRSTVVHQPTRNVAEEQAKMKEIYNTIFSMRAPDKRVLAEIFAKLPTREQYPEYFDKVKKPIDLSKILTKINANNYESLKNFFADLKLVFDNACLFNDPSSQIYKDALILQMEILQLRNQYLNDKICISSEIKLILMKIFVAVSTFTSNGRYLSESLDDAQKFLKKSGVTDEEMPFSLDEIKYNLDKGRYRRVDRFQDDFFYLLAKIREHAPITSELFRDTIELQKHFIDKRENVCKDILITPAKLYSRSELDKELEFVRKRQKQKDQAAAPSASTETTTTSTAAEPEASMEQATSEENEALNNSAESNDEASVEFDGKTYYPDDYVYVASADDNAPPDAPKHIMRIERIFHDDGISVVRGIWCYKPRETYHLATRLFFPNEVFLTPFRDTVTVDRLRGKCCVMFAEDYLRAKPLEFDDSDVYVCESKYLGRKQHFKKLAAWPYPEEVEKLKLEKRSEPLKVTKIKSELAKDGLEADFSEKKARSESAQPKDAENADDDFHEIIPGVVSERVKNLPRILDIHRDEVKDAKNQSNENCTFYEQMLHNGIWYRRGDGVLAFREKAGYCDVYRIDKMWRNNNGDAFISGPYFARPHEVKHDADVTFFKREVIAVEQPDITINMNLIQSRCVILPTKIYETCRPTEFPECDVFIVDRKVWGETPISDWKQCSLVGGNYEPSVSSGFPLDLNDSRPLKKNLRKYPQSLDVPEDEIYYFQEPIKMEKEPSPQIAGTENALTVKHEELDTEIKSINEATVIAAEAGPAALEKGTAKWLETQPKLNAKSKSGYILFSAEVRKRVMSENPDSSFGEISRIVGVEWKKLSDEQKRQYESRAQYIAQERAKNDLLTPNSKMLQPGQVRVYICKWTNCDFQFDCQDGLYEHIKTAHTSKIVSGENQQTLPISQYVCLWQSCLKYRKEGKPFPSLPRLHRHMKEKHLPHSSKAMLPNQRSKHYFVYIAPDESAPHGKGEAPSGHFVNHQFGNANPNAPVCTLATPLEDIQTTLTTAPARTYAANVMSDSTPQRTVKVVNAVYQNQQNGTYVQQIPSGSLPVQYVTVGGQPVYQAVVVNHAQGQQPVHVYHQTPQGTIVQAQQVSNQYYQQIPQTSGNHQTISIQNASHIGHSQTYQTSGHVQLQQTPVHVSYQPSTSHNQTLPPPTPIQQQQYQPAPPVDPRTIITRAPEPTFAPVSQQTYHVRRALHSKTYLTYLENLGKQRCISNWKNGESLTRDKLDMIRRAPKRKVTEEELANGLYLLRDQLLESTCGIKKYSDIKLL